MDRTDLARVVNDLYSFYRLFVGSDFRENLEAPHLRRLSQELMGISLDGGLSRLCVSMPPRHGKSSMVTLAYPLWLIFRNPNLNILIVNNTISLSEKFGISLREYVKKFGRLFNVYLSDAKHSSSHLMFENEDGELYRGSIRLQGSSGSITGQDADYLIIDDPYKGFEDITPSLLEKKLEWFKVMILQRLEPSSHLIILHTRWHSRDIQGYLLDEQPEEYKFVSFPALGPEGEPLWPERYSTEMLMQRRKEMGDRLFESIYQQKPLDMTSDFFMLDGLRFGKPEYMDSNPRVIRAWDIASSGPDADNDFTVGVKMERHGENAVITDLRRGQFGNKTKSEIQRIARLDSPAVMIGIETGVAAAGKLLFEEWQSQLPGFRVQRAQAYTSKEDRATPLANAIFDGKVYLDLPDAQRGEFMAEFSAFPLGEHDDIVDAVAHAYNLLFSARQHNTRLGVVYL